MGTQKTKEKDARIKNNATTKGSVYKLSNPNTNNIGKIPSIEKFTEFWVGIWENKTQTENKSWMKNRKGDYFFNTFAKFFEKLTFLCEYQGLKNASLI